MVAVGTTATPVLPANPSRVKWFVANKSSNPGHLHNDNSVSTSKGFPLTQQGGNITMERDGPEGVGSSVHEAVWGLNETAQGDWYVVAWVDE